MRPARAGLPALLAAAGLTAAAALADESRPGGPASVPRRDTARAFAHPAADLPSADALAFLDGQALFDKLWVGSPASTRASDGLGPHYNARSCAACHPGNGRGAPPEPGETPVALVVLSAGPDGDPDPVYGHQIQPFATAGLPAEARPRLDWETTTANLGDGTEIALRRPSVSLHSYAYGRPAEDTLLGPRIAPPLLGLGLLAAIPAADILAREDPDDRDGDGISGRANRIDGALGRFGWKAGSTSVANQTSRAFSLDLGLSSPDRPGPWGDCTAAQAPCHTAPHGDGHGRAAEVSRAALDAVALYAANIGVPMRGSASDPLVMNGEALFHAAGCAACHTPSYVLPGGPIYPYTDLLLHDLGPGLADGIAEGEATGREWRTPPLWGIGLTGAVLGETTYLHDGRAQSLTAAILWHGGEAQPARDAFAAMPGPERAALIRFLESL